MNTEYLFDTIPRINRRKNQKMTNKNDYIVYVIGFSVIIIICIIVIVIVIKKKISEETLQLVMISHYHAKLGTGELSTVNTSYSSSPKYISVTKYSSTADLPKLVTKIPARYLAIINNNTFPINIPIDSINIFISETSFVPAKSVPANVVKATIMYPDAGSGRSEFIFNNIATFNGIISPNEIALIKIVSNNPVNLYSLSFKYTTNKTIPLTLFIFNPPSNVNFDSGEVTTFTSFYQANLNNISNNTTIVIDFE